MRIRLRHATWFGLIVCSTAFAQASVTATAIGTPLDLDGEGSSGTYIVKVADVSFGTDNPAGCTLTVSSGSLARAGGSSIAYQVAAVADGAPPPAPGDFTVPSGSDLTASITSATSADRDIYVKYATRAQQDPGTYGATLVFSVGDH